jgi:ATP-binding cassette, subfamily B, bacterial PglK
MFYQISTLLNILNKEQKIRFFILSILMIFSGLFEILSIISLVEFVGFLSNDSTEIGFGFFKQISELLDVDYEIFNLQNIAKFIILILIITAFFNLCSIYLTAKFSSTTGGELESSLFNYYLSRNYIYHLDVNSSKLLNNIFELIPRVSQFVIAPLMLILSKIIFLLPLLVGLAVYKTKITIISILIFLSLYLILFKVFKNKLSSLGLSQNTITKNKFTILQEGFGSIREIKILNKLNFFKFGYANLYKRLVRIDVLREVIGKFPRYFVEVVTLTTSILLILYLNNNLNYSFEKIIISISFFMICAYKIIPAFQQIYYHLTIVKNHLPALIEVYDDLINSKLMKKKREKIVIKNFSNRQFENLEIRNLDFNYDKRNLKVLKDINFKVRRGEKIAITGSSGSGKTTFIHILLGLIKQSRGSILMNGEEIVEENLPNWQKLIGFVPQTIFLTDKSLSENIAFAVKDSEIDIKRIKKLISFTHLSLIVNNLPKKENTRVGERGIKFSGGQQQRLGLARALYNNPEIIILDEATNALDILTEKKIIDSLKSFNKDVTIFMIAHRLEVIKKFDKILFLNNGKLEDYGTFEELSNRNKSFKNMLNIKD